MSKYTKENALRCLAPHIHIPKRNQRIYNAGIAIFCKLDVKTLKHGDRFGKAVFRLLEEDLYEEEFYRFALPIIKEEWEINRTATQSE